MLCTVVVLYPDFPLRLSLLVRCSVPLLYCTLIFLSDYLYQLEALYRCCIVPLFSSQTISISQKHCTVVALYPCFPLRPSLLVRNTVPLLYCNLNFLSDYLYQLETLYRCCIVPLFSSQTISISQKHCAVVVLYPDFPLRLSLLVRCSVPLLYCTLVFLSDHLYQLETLYRCCIVPLFSSQTISISYKHCTVVVLYPDFPLRLYLLVRNTVPLLYCTLIFLSDYLYQSDALYRCCIVPLFSSHTISISQMLCIVVVLYPDFPLRLSLLVRNTVPLLYCTLIFLSDYLYQLDALYRCCIVPLFSSQTISISQILCTVVVLYPCFPLTLSLLVRCSVPLLYCTLVFLSDYLYQLETLYRCCIVPLFSSQTISISYKHCTVVVLYPDFPLRPSLLVRNTVPLLYCTLIVLSDYLYQLETLYRCCIVP